MNSQVTERAMRLVFDIEADGLDPTMIHCIVAH